MCVCEEWEVVCVYGCKEGGECVRVKWEVVSACVCVEWELLRL